MSLLLTHLNALEERLLSLAGAQTTAGRLRDSLAGEFLQPLFGTAATVASGRIADSRSPADATALPCADLLLCQRQALRLPGIAGPDIFLAETVVAAITVLPTLDAAAMAAAVRAAQRIKTLRRGAGVPVPDMPPGSPPAAIAAEQAVPCLLLAFDGPAQLTLAHIWLKQAYRDAAIVEPELPDGGAAREAVASPALDGVFVLGRGFLGFDNVPLGIFDDESRALSMGACWAIANATRGSLAALCLHLQLLLNAAAPAAIRLDLRPYLGGFGADSLRLGN